MKQKSGTEKWKNIVTFMYDYFLFLQLILFYFLCFILGAFTTIIDRFLRTKKMTNGLSSFFYFLANL